MSPPGSRALAGALILLALAGTARALIVYDDGNELPGGGPPAGLPFNHVARISTGASGVYLGNGFLLTANHVDLGPSNTAYAFNGTNSTRDTSFEPVRIEEADLKLIRLLDPPNLPQLPIANSSTADAGGSVVVGWGVGKGDATSGGWLWGNSTTNAWRWGNVSTFVNGWTNSTAGNQTALVSTFTPNANVATCTIGDSGGGLFIRSAGGWLLSGTVFAVSPSGTSLHTPPSSRSVNFFIRLRDVAHLLRIDAWKFATFGNASASDAADNDRDGLSTLGEYALARNPNAADLPFLSINRTANGTVTLDFTQRMSATDVAVVVQESADTITWANSTVTRTTLSKNGTAWTIRAVRAGPDPPPFYRLFIRRE